MSFVGERDKQIVFFHLRREVARIDDSRPRDDIGQLEKIVVNVRLHHGAVVAVDLAELIEQQIAEFSRIFQMVEVVGKLVFDDYVIFH